MSPTLQALIDAAEPLVLTCAPPTPQDLLREKRSQATRANREHERAEKEETLASVDGDREALCRIVLWEKRDKTDRDGNVIREKILARGFEKRFIGGAKCDEEHDDADKKVIASVNSQSLDCETGENVSEYVLVKHIVPRARHPDEERAWAKAQGRYRETRPSISGFFADPSVRQRKLRDPAPIGDYNWVDDEVPASERQVAHKRGAARSKKAEYIDRSFDSALASITRVPGEYPTTCRVG